MGFELQDIRGQPPKAQNEVLAQLSEQIEGEDIEDYTGVAEKLLLAHEEELTTVQASSWIPRLLRELGNTNAGPFLVSKVIDTEYDVELILETLAESGFDDSEEIQRLAKTYIEQGHPDINLLEPILENNFSGEDIVLPLNPYYDKNNKITRGIDVLSAIETDVYDDELIEIYRRVVNNRLNRNIGNKILSYFSDEPPSELISLIEESLEKQLEMGNRRRQRQNLNSKEIEVLASSGSEGISKAIQLLSEVSHRDARRTIVNAIQKQSDHIDRRSLDAIKEFLYEEQRIHDTLRPLVTAVISQGTLRDLNHVLEETNLSDVNRYGSQVTATLSRCPNNSDIITFVEHIDQRFIRDNSSEILDAISSNTTWGIYELLGSDIPETNMNELQEDIINRLSEAKSDDLTLALIDLLEGGIRPDIVSKTLQSRWPESMDFLLDALTQTSRNVTISHLQRPFRGLSDHHIEFIINAILGRDELTPIQKETLRIGVTTVDSETRTASQDWLIEAINDNLHHPRTRELCLCLDRLRYSGQEQQNITSNKLAILDRDSMPEPLPGLKDIIVHKHESNETRSILTIFEHLSEIDSELCSEILAVLPNDVESDVAEYQSSTSDLATFTSKETSEIIDEGENLQIEFKNAKADDEDVMKEIESMLNTKGGHIIIGVNDGGSVSGLSGTDWDVDEPGTRLQNLIGDYIRPEPVIDGRPEKINGEQILRIDIPDGDMKPYFHREPDSNSVEVRIRMGSTKVYAGRRHIINLVQNSSWYESGSRER